MPGNVRELANAIEHAVALSERSCLELDDLPSGIVGEGRTRSLRDEVEAGHIDFAAAVTRFERVGAEGDGADRVGMPSEATLLGPSGHLPYLDRLICTGGSQPLAIGTEGDGRDRVGVARRNRQRE